MARPLKKGVDYFPHDCVSGKTLYILEQKHGNDGYAFWYKLLELIGTKNGHFLDCNNAADMEFLQAKTRLDKDCCLKILDLLATLEAIDQELWKNKLIWSQEFVDRISDVYANRRMKTPEKPNYYKSKPDEAEVSTSKSTQSKVKESKVKETKANAAALAASSEADHQRDLKKEYEELQKNMEGKDPREVYRLIREFVQTKKPAFAEPYVDAWNIFAPSNNLEQVKDITPDRREKIRIRSREPGFDFFKILGAIRQNAFYKGENSSNWKIDFNYVIHSQKNYVKLIEKFKE